MIYTLWLRAVGESFDENENCIFRLIRDEQIMAAFGEFLASAIMDFPGHRESRSFRMLVGLFG